MAEGGVDAPSPAESNYLIYAAIDFGTTYTGYAYAFKHEMEKEHKVVCTSTWKSEDMPVPTEKAPTILLLDTNKELFAFGYDAEEKFITLDTDERKKWYYFERFKMKLYETKKLSRNSVIKDHMGRDHSATYIFSSVIAYLKKHLKETLDKRLIGVGDHEIYWTLTVPAIWSDAAKQLMRESANKAGIEDKDLKLILEPEAASSLVNTMDVCKVAKHDDTQAIEPFSVGMKYIVADLGGGTADLAVHEVLGDRRLREVSRSDGDAYGGLMVNTAFEKFLESALGEEIIRQLQEKNMEDYMSLKDAFEIRKKTFNSGKNVKMLFPYVTVKEILAESYESKVKEIKEKYGGDFEIHRDKCILSSDLMKSFFDDAVDGIIKFIKGLRQNESESTGLINVLVMVGGFSESQYVQEKIKRDVPGLRIIVPPNPSIAVLKGAVLLGHRPLIITERIARFTYGFSNLQIFDPNIHPDSLKIVHDGVEFCNEVFCKVIEKGQILKVGEKFSLRVIQVCSNILEMFLPSSHEIYRSNDKDPKFTLEEYGSTCVGRVIGFAPKGGWAPCSRVEQSLVVGESEFSVVVTDTDTKHAIESKLDFLGDGETAIVGQNECKIQ